MLNDLDLDKMEEIERMRGENGDEAESDGPHGGMFSTVVGGMTNSNVQMGDVHKTYNFTGKQFLHYRLFIFFCSWLSKSDKRVV